MLITSGVGGRRECKSEGVSGIGEEWKGGGRLWHLGTPVSLFPFGLIANWELGYSRERERE